MMTRAWRMFRQNESNWARGKFLLPAARQVPFPTSALRAARYLGLLLVVCALVAALAPWRQNISGTGRVIEYLPNNRPQDIQAPISGQIVRWRVVEGARVAKNDVLLELSDNDPERLQRLEVQRDAARARLDAYQAQVIAYDERLQALLRSQRAEVQAAEAEVRVAKEAVQAKRELLIAANAQVETEQVQLKRIEGLADQGLASERERELAILNATRAEANLQSQQAEVRSAESNLRTKQAQLQRITAATEADLRSATAAIRTAETQVAGAQAALADAESVVAQQKAQVVRAPRDGVIQRVQLQQGGVQVTKGQTLAVLVPHAQSRAVELSVDGNDAPLISPGRTVRLQFEGWPAVQMVGWPSVAVGTFGGKVAFVDPSDDGRGGFRIVVVPDSRDEPWPTGMRLRQGTRANGWVLLDEVRVGFEIWRQINGFPPGLSTKPTVDAGLKQGARQAQEASK